MAAASAVALLVALLVSPVQATPVPFAIKVAPSRYQVAIPKQRIVALVRIRNVSPTSAPVTLTAQATNARVRLRTTSASADQVVEVRIVPRAPGSVHVTITGTRQGLTKHRSIDIEVWEGQDGVRAYATQLRDRFVAWLATEHPEFGLGASTEWHPTIVWPYLLEVSHYLFFTRGWELGLSWHIMIPPYDWTTIYLRSRDRLRPSRAFQIDSVSDPQATPYEIPPPPEVMR
jgi:hypothetical protein